MSLLEITNLSHSFSENVLYKNADFSLNKEEHVGIVGQNGTGKSTLIKLCTGQLLPDINVNIKMYIFDHLRMYIFAILPLDRYIFLSDKIFL